MKFWGSRKNKICFMLLLYVLIQGFTLDQYVYAATEDFTPTSYTVNGVSYTDKVRAVSSYPVLIETYDLGNGSKNYLFEITVSLNTTFPADSDYYSQYSTATVKMEYPSTANVLQTQVLDYNNTDNWNVSMYAYTSSSASHSMQAYFRIQGIDKYVNKTTRYQSNLVNYKVRIRTGSETAPTISITNISSAISFTDGQSYIEIIKDAIENSETAEDVADILTNSGLTLTQVQNIASQLGVANNHLTYIQEYAYEIWDILARRFPTEASQNMEDAESNLSDINNDIEQYTPPTVNADDVNNNANNSFQQMNIEGDSNNLFFYLNWSSILPILTLIFSLAILSYVLYGGK